MPSAFSAVRMPQIFFHWMRIALLGLSVALPASAETVYAREFKGGIELEPGRVLAWEFVSDGSGEMPLWIFQDGHLPRQVGKLRAEQIAAATGANAIVLVADQRLWVMSASEPAQPAPIELPGEWLSVGHGPMGFVIGGWGDTAAISPDGKAWTPFEFKAPGEGGITRLASNGRELLALRQTSVMEEGWGINVSELCLSSDGKEWRRVAHFEGGNNGEPVEAIAWVGDRWIGHGFGALVELTIDGQSRRIAPTSEDGENALFGGNVAVFREGERWLLASDAGVAASDDLMDWKLLPGAAGDGIKGGWLAGRDGAPRFVGATQRDWSKQRLLTLAQVLNPSSEKPAIADAAKSPAEMRGRDTVYDWAAIMDAASKRAASAPPRVLDEAITKKRGTKTNAWSKGSPWTAADMLAAFRKGASAKEVVEVMGLDYDGADLDKPGILAVLTSDEWPAAVAKSKSLFDPQGSLVEINLWGLVHPRSTLADALAREVIARRQQDVVPATKPVDSPELRRRLAAGEAEAAYQLYQLYFGMRDEADRTPVPADLPPADQLLAQATKDYAPAQWLLASQFEHNADKTKNDPLRVFELYWISANAGDATAAFKLAKLFAAPGNENGVARNYAEAEYWFIEAAVRAWPGQMDLPYQRPWLELANLYSAQSANDVLSSLMPTYEDATARWLRLMIDRGGAMADYAKLAIRYFDAESRGNPNAFNYAKRIATIPPELPVLSADEWRKIEAAAADRAVDLLRVADAYAGGRLVRQNDVKAVEFYHRAAEAGAGLPAYRALMHHYRNGYGVNKDMAQWLAWLRQAAADDIASLLELGDALHFVHEGVTPDYAAAMAAYERAAALGDARALHSIGLMHRYGRGGPKNEAKWREFMERAAAKGHTRAMADIAYSYVASEVPWEKKNHVEAAIWYRKAVDAGDRSSRFALAEALQNSKDAAGAQKWLLEIVAEEPRHVQALYKLAQMAHWDGRRDEAARWYRDVAALETIYDFMKEEAQRFVREYDEEEAAKPGSLPYFRKKAKTGTTDDMFDYAMRAAASDRAEAETWLAAAADQGHAPATVVYYEWLAQKDKPAAEKWIGFLAEKGNSQAVLIVGLLTAATDKPAGLALMRQAAEAGNADASFRIGMMQYNGNELPQDREAGLAAIARAADAGFPMAQFTLGRALLKGDVGLSADPARAVGYLERAMKQNYAAPVALQAAVLLGQVYESGQIAGVKTDLDAAVEAFKRATELDPRNTKLLEHYHELTRRMSMEMKMRGGR